MSALAVPPNGFNNGVRNDGSSLDLTRFEIRLATLRTQSIRFLDENSCSATKRRKRRRSIAQWTDSATTAAATTRSTGQSVLMLTSLPNDSFERDHLVKRSPL